MSGAAGSNECPAGSVRIETEAACRTAAAAVGKNVLSDLPFVETFSYFPRGCAYGTISNWAFFNPHAVGAGHLGRQLLCAVLATTGARVPNR